MNVIFLVLNLFIWESKTHQAAALAGAVGGFKVATSLGWSMIINDNSLFLFHHFLFLVLQGGLPARMIPYSTEFLNQLNTIFCTMTNNHHFLCASYFINFSGSGVYLVQICVRVWCDKRKRFILVDIGSCSWKGRPFPCHSTPPPLWHVCSWTQPQSHPPGDIRMSEASFETNTLVRVLTISRAPSSDIVPTWTTVSPFTSKHK